MNPVHLSITQEEFMAAWRDCGKHELVTAFKPRISEHYRFVLALGFCSLLAGCGGRSDLGLVTGQVTLDGKPVADASVEFTPTMEGSIATGRTDSSGEYSLMFTRDVAGASLGENLVRISTFDVDYVEGKGEVSIPERIPAKYNRNSELKVTVEPGKNRHDFELVSAGANVSQPRLTPGL